jgi:amphi-Trp domain-containing protein
MGEKTVLIDTKDTVLRYDAAMLLKKLADELAQGKLVTANGDVAVGGEVKLECKGKFKPKEGGSKGLIKVELSWFVPGA